MNWKNWPYWVKGLVIGLIFGIIWSTVIFFSSYSYTLNNVGKYECGFEGSSKCDPSHAFTYGMWSVAFFGTPFSLIIILFCVIFAGSLKNKYALVFGIVVGIMLSYRDINGYLLRNGFQVSISLVSIIIVLGFSGFIIGAFIGWLISKLLRIVNKASAKKSKK